MPEEIAVIAVVAILSGTVLGIVKQALQYARDKRQLGHASSAQGSSLTTSELHTMLREAVEDAVQPLERKIDRLERQLDARGELGRPPEKPLLAAHDDERLS